MKSLDDLKENETARIVSIEPNNFKKRLLEIGIIKDAEVRVIRYAPLRDPIEISINGYPIALRREEARYIKVK